MVVHRRIPRFPLKGLPACAALGIFDGVHPGHRAILRKAVSVAKARGSTPTAVTFHPHPLRVLRPRFAPPLLMPLEKRLQAISACGIRLALVIPFTRSFSRWSPERFAKELLVKRLRVRDVVVGANFRFGAGRRGSVSTLQRLGARHGFKVHVIAPVRLKGERVSSSRLREWIRQGRISLARRLMKASVTVTGRVVRGAGRGRKLGFATANLKVESGVLPPAGVYAVRGGMANIGFRPTFPGRAVSPLLEVHLFGRKGSLYGRRLEVEFLRRLRGERRFSSPGALSRQLSVDARRAKWYTQQLRSHAVS